MDAVVLIPARLESERFPRKVLAAETGWPLIRHVYERGLEAGARVVVATDAAEVVEAVRGFGGESVLTGTHDNGTARLAEAASLLGLGDDEIVVNVQGDEPEVEPATIAASREALMADDSFSMGTVATPILDEEEFASPDVVKVVVGAGSGVFSALYFSRAPIPHERGGGGFRAALRHIGIYAYRAGFLRRYAALPASRLETTERLEQLRALENGYRIGVAEQRVTGGGIDTPEQYEAFVERWRAGGG